MPHIIVKLWPGESEQQKQKLAAEITKDVMPSNRICKLLMFLECQSQRMLQLTRADCHQ